MFPCRLQNRVKSSCLWTCALLLVAAPGLAPAAAAESVVETSSLRYVPEDASFYWARLRMREQVEAVIHSRAVAKLLDLPLIKLAREQAAELQAQAGAPDLADLKPLIEDAENKQLYNLLLDAVSHEIFIYGDKGHTELMLAMQRLTRQMSAIQDKALAEGREPGDEELGRQIGELVIDELGRLKIPTTVIGFKLTDAQAAETQLARLEAMIAVQIELLPGWEGRLKREAIGGTSLITLRLDGSLIPWEQIEAQREKEFSEQEQEQYEKLVEAVKKLTIVVSIGVRDGYLLVSISDSIDHLASLGAGPLLAGRPEMAPLRRRAAERITSIGYVSQQMSEQSNQVEFNIDRYAALAEQLLALSQLDPALRQELIADVRSLAEDVKRYIPKPGAKMSFSFMSPRGLEGYSHDWSENLILDGSQKLTILDHVGGQPLAFSAARTKYAPQDYDLTVKWIKRAVYYFEQIGVPQLEPEQREFYNLLRFEFSPLIERLDDATRRLWLPAFRDGQRAVVLDAKVTSKQWQSDMPEAAQPLPILEVGMVYGVSDASLVRRAGAAYLAIAREATRKLHELMPEQVPDFEPPLPTPREFPEGTVFYYNPPKAWGLDVQIAPNAALSDQVLALSLIPKFSLRLLRPTPLEMQGPLARSDQPLAAASYFDFAGLLDAFVPWMDYGWEQVGALALQQDAGDLDDPDADGADELPAPRLSPEEIKEGVRPILDFLKCLRTISSVSYFEEGALVTHSEWHLVDPE